MSTRRERDDYQTDMAQALVVPLLPLIPVLSGDVLEPCAGKGRMSHAISTLYQTPVYTNDISPQYHTNWTSDATNLEAPIWQRMWGWVITNPPFSLAPKILPLAWEHAIEGVAFLLRLSYAEPARNRYRWLQRYANHQRFLIPFNPRPHFRRSEINPKTNKPYGTDNVTVAWFVWMKRWDWFHLGIASPFQYIHGWR